MNLLLDTHVALWAITDHPKLSAVAREMISAPRTTVWVSAVNIWEITIKYSLGRKSMPLSGKKHFNIFPKQGIDYLLLNPNMRQLWRI